MGYPLTFKRLINRSGLHDGNYREAPEKWQVGVNLDSPGLRTETLEVIESPDDPEFLLDLAPFWRERIRRYDQAIKFFAGDLRRLEKDAVDENSICQNIALRTGVDPDIVAVVLKEFMSF